jgi:hypothetical protein
MGFRSRNSSRHFPLSDKARERDTSLVNKPCHVKGARVSVKGLVTQILQCYKN